jgi:hypothetical protein
MAATTLPQVRFALDPKAPMLEQVAIYVDGALAERCALAEKAARLAHYGYQAPPSPRHGFTQNGRPISRKVGRLQQGGR